MNLTTSYFSSWKIEKLKIRQNFYDKTISLPAIYKNFKVETITHTHTQTSSQELFQINKEIKVDAMLTKLKKKTNFD